jgi:hypothetical protein
MTTGAHVFIVTAAAPLAFSRKNIEPTFQKEEIEEHPEILRIETFLRHSVAVAVRPLAVAIA